jgi:hypothetical protein
MNGKVFEFLDIESLKNLASTSREFNQCIKTYISEIWVGFLPILPHYSKIVMQIKDPLKIIIHNQAGLKLTGFSFDNLLLRRLLKDRIHGNIDK